MQCQGHDELGRLESSMSDHSWQVPYLTGPLVAPQEKQTRVRLHLSAITLNSRVRWMRSILDDLHHSHV